METMTINIFRRQSKGLQIMSFDNLAMLDWDFPDEGHETDTCITIAKASDVLDILLPYTEQHRSTVFYLEHTRGGVRGWDLTRPYSTEQYHLKHGALLCDPLYCICTQRAGVFNCRVSAKPGRDNDVITPWCMVGVGTPHPTCVSALRIYHMVLARNGMLNGRTI